VIEERVPVPKQRLLADGSAKVTLSLLGLARWHMRAEPGDDTSGAAPIWVKPG
jgi:hypothetical protein